MNNLSWFIYLISVVDSLRGVASAILAIGGFCFALAGVLCIAGYLIEEEEGPLRMWKQTIKWGGPVLALCLLIVILLPDRRTMLLIAGSEMGERAIKTDTVRDVVNPGMDLLKAWIKAETDKLTKSGEKK